MIKHRPDDNMLAEYAAGSLDWGLSLAVAAHLHFCSSSRDRVQQLNAVGGALLSTSEPEAIDSDAFQRLMDRIKTQGKGSTAANDGAAKPKVASKKLGNDPLLVDLPPVVRRLLPEGKPVKWRFVSPALRMARLQTGQDKYEVAFHRICTGGKVAEHDHQGLEVTLVLKGSFSDGDGVYTEGDFLVRQPGDVHRPTATQNQDCLCLSVVEAPVSLTGVMGKLINPFLSVRPS